MIWFIICAADTELVQLQKTHTTLIEQRQNLNVRKAGTASQIQRLEVEKSALQQTLEKDTQEAAEIREKISAIEVKQIKKTDGGVHFHPDKYYQNITPAKDLTKKYAEKTLALYETGKQISAKENEIKKLNEVFQKLTLDHASVGKELDAIDAQIRFYAKQQDKLGQE